MLVGPLPWKKSGRETWQKVSRSSRKGGRELRESKGEGIGRKGQSYIVEIISNIYIK